MQCGYFDTTRKGDHSSFLTPTVVGGPRPFRLQCALKVTHSFEKRLFRQISAYDVSTVRDSGKSSTMTNIKSTTGFPTSYRWTARRLPPSRQKGLKKRLFCLFNIIQFQSNEVCYKVSLYENFQRQQAHHNIVLHIQS